MSMSKRLKIARINAGFDKASVAIRKFNWQASTYRAHESGQNEFGVEAATRYSEAFNTTVEWLLLGTVSNKVINRDNNHSEAQILLDNICMITNMLKKHSDPELVKLLVMNVEQFTHYGLRSQK